MLSVGEGVKVSLLINWLLIVSVVHCTGAG